MPTELNDHEKKHSSQFGEDGITLEIFSRIGATNCKFVEIGSSSGPQCNTSILSIGFGWTGLLIEKNEQRVVAGGKNYARIFKDKRGSVSFANEFVTAENINEVLAANKMTGAIDFLSIDIDGNDYWVWKAISIIKPRVVVIEYNATLGTERSATIKYDPDFVWKSKKPPLYFGASLKALASLGIQKGYSLVACESTGANAFFVLSELADRVPSASVKEAYFPRPGWPKGLSEEKQQEIITALDFVDV